MKTNAGFFGLAFFVRGAEQFLNLFHPPRVKRGGDHALFAVRADRNGGQDGDGVGLLECRDDMFADLLCRVLDDGHELLNLPRLLIVWRDLVTRRLIGCGGSCFVGHAISRAGGGRDQTIPSVSKTCHRASDLPSSGLPIRYLPARGVCKMLSRHSLSMFVCACLLTLPADAQTPSADPFGGGTPFGNADPFKRPAQSKRAAPPAGVAGQAVQKVPPKKVPQKVAAKGTAEERIAAALSRETTVSFIETPLSDAAQAISEMHDIPVIIDNRALEEIGLDAETPITIDLRNVTLRSLLRLMLRDCDLTYMVKDEVLQITTAEAAESNLILKMYKLSGKLENHGEQIVTAINRTVTPGTWDSLGGTSTIISIDHVLIVSATSDVHSKVESFLSELAEKFGDE